MKILLAVSGGVDSMYLAHNAGDFFPGCSFVAAHCNFSLRGEESEGDEAFVREWCKKHGMPLYVKKFETAGIAAERGISIEMAARELRYRWFAELCAKEGLDGVAVAHNANDNAETFMLNILRGTGSRGMRGMSPRGHIPGTDYLLLRPMLGISRNEIESWMTARGLGWREDSTNSHTVYKRNRIRHEVFPAFSAINPSFLAAFERDMANIKEADSIADDYFKESIEKIINPDGSIPILELKRLKHWKYILYRFVEHNIHSSTQYADLISLLESDRQTGGRKFGDVVTTSDRIILCGNSTKEDGIVVLTMDRPADLELKQPKGTLIMDADIIPYPPAIRPWHEGDWMIPLGMHGRKKISDLMTDLKFSLEEKKKAEVIQFPGQDCRVAALVGHRIDDSVKITTNTTHIIMVKSK